MDVKKPKLFTTRFNNNNDTLVQVIANDVACRDAVIGTSKSFAQLVRLLNFKIVGGYWWDIGIANSAMDFRSLSVTYQLKLLNQVVTGFTSGGVDDEGLLSFPNEANFFPGIVIDEFVPMVMGGSVALNNNWVPVGALRYRMEFELNYYVESDYQDYIESLNRVSQWG